MNYRATLENIQALRWLAAALVFLQHAVVFSGQVGGDPMLNFRKLSFGSVGVYLFFIISGFVIALQTKKKPTQFLLHRIIRIYPAYFIAIVASVLIFYIFSEHRPEINSASLSMLLIPTGILNGSFQIPYWTLIYEIFFYTLILFLMVIFRNRSSLIDISILAWLALIIAAVHLNIQIDTARPSAAQILLSPFNIYFISGFFLSRVFFSENPNIAFMALLTIAVTRSFSSALGHLATICALGVTCIVWIIKLPPFPKFLNNLGDYSYGIYLMHLPIIYCLFLELKSNGASFTTSIILMTAVALPVSILFGRLEHWLYKKKIRPAVDNFYTNKAQSNFSPIWKIR